MKSPAASSSMQPSSAGKGSMGSVEGRSFFTWGSKSKTEWKRQCFGYMLFYGGFFHQFLKVVCDLSLPTTFHSPTLHISTQQGTMSWSSLCKNHLASGKQLWGLRITEQPLLCGIRIVFTIWYKLSNTQLGWVDSCGYLQCIPSIPYVPTFPNFSCSYISTM